MECREQAERFVLRERFQVPPGGKVTRTLSFAKKLTGKGVRVIALGKSAPKKLSAALSVPSSGRLFSVDEDYDWGSEEWRDIRAPNLFPAAGVWTVEFKNDSPFTPARVDGFAVEVYGYSLDQCQTATPRAGE